MKRHELSAVRDSLRTLRLSTETTDEEHDASMRVLGDFNASMAGLIRFSGETPWERHPEDELLFVLGGQADITLLPAGGPAVTESLTKDSLFIVPRGVWHRQYAPSDVSLLFVTAKAGDDISWSEDPRAGT